MLARAMLSALIDLAVLKAVNSVTVVSGCADGNLRAAEGDNAKYALLPFKKLDACEVDVVGLFARCMSMPEIETKES